MVFELLARLEELSRSRPDRVLRLTGELPGDEGGLEPFELLIFRGFSSSVSHPTAFDPDQPALPETALIASLEGKRGMPIPRPPFPAVKGLWGKPTVINNVETWANIPMIILKGSAWFSSIGTMPKVTIRTPRMT